jgi:transposase-like protein
VARLRKELREAREERDILKRAVAFFAPGGLYSFVEAEKVERRNVA